MRLPLPGPFDLVHAVRDVASAALALGSAATSAIALVGLLDRADVAMVHIEQVARDGDAMVRAVGPLLAGAGGLVDNAYQLLAKARGPLEKLMPLLERVAETMDPSEVDAAVLLIDKLPEMLTLVEQDVLPLMRRLDTVGPELHAMLELVEDLHHMVAGLPGMKLRRRRGENESED